jgi:hypothetical protein
MIVYVRPGSLLRVQLMAGGSVFGYVTCRHRLSHHTEETSFLSCIVTRHRLTSPILNKQLIPEIANRQDPTVIETDMFCSSSQPLRHLLLSSAFLPRFSLHVRDFPRGRCSWRLGIVRVSADVGTCRHHSHT